MPLVPLCLQKKVRRKPFGKECFYLAVLRVYFFFFLAPSSLSVPAVLALRSTPCISSRFFLARVCVPSLFLATFNALLSFPTLSNSTTLFIWCESSRLAD